jgi:hypothetical protein
LFPPTRYRLAPGQSAPLRRQTADPHMLIAIGFSKQLRQPRDVNGDPPRLVLRQDFGLPRLGIVVAGVEVRQRLPVGVADDLAAGLGVGVTRGWKAAGWFGHHGTIAKKKAPVRLAMGGFGRGCWGPGAAQRLFIRRS